MKRHREGGVRWHVLWQLGRLARGERRGFALALRMVMVVAGVGLSLEARAQEPLADPVMLHLDRTDVEIQRQKFLNVETGGSMTLNEAMNPDGSSEILSDAQVEQRATTEAVFYRAQVGAIRESFRDELIVLMRTDPDRLIPVMVEPIYDPTEVPLGPSVEELRGLSDDETDAMVQDRIDEVDRVITTATRDLMLEMNRLGAQNVERSPLSPLVHALMMPDQILDLATQLPVAKMIYEGVVDYQPELTTSTCAMGADTVATRGISAVGWEVAVLESNQVQGGLSCLNLTGMLDDSSVEPHPTAVASVVGSTLGSLVGTAPGVNILSADIDQNLFTINNIEDGLLWAYVNGADVINMSMGTDDSGTVLGEDVMIDAFIRNHRRLLVKSSGNISNTCTGTNNVTNPGMGFNMLTVGNYNDGGSCGTADDTISSGSCFGNPSSPHGDREKPEVAAPGTNITVLDESSDPPNCQTRTTSGTSLSAPHVSATAALLIERDVALKSWPEALRAVLIASAHNNVEGAVQLSDMDGAGGIQAELADDIARRGQWDARVVNHGTFVGDSMKVIATFPVDNTATRIKAATAWSSLPGTLIPFSVTGPAVENDFDLFLYRRNFSGPDELIGSSVSFDNSYETLDVSNPPQGTYDLYVQLVNGTLAAPGNSSEYLATAWSIIDPCLEAGGDADDDGVCGDDDNCPSTNNPSQTNSDNDEHGNACDNCPLDDNPDQANHDHDSAGDVCDPDDDNDGCDDDMDDDPLDGRQRVGTWFSATCSPSSGILYGPAGTDSDDDGILDCDPSETDNDGDNIPDAVDPCPIHEGPSHPLCSILRDCPVTTWWDVCQFGGCNEFFVKIESVINPVPIIFDTIEVVNQTLYLFPSLGVSLEEAAQSFSTGASDGDAIPNTFDRIRVELWQRFGNEERFVALIAQYSAFSPDVGDLGAGVALAITPMHPEAPEETSVQIAASWSLGTTLEDPPVDSDEDGTPDPFDNCAGLVNPDQRDTNGDQIGNACDPDFNNDGVVGIPDFNLIRLGFTSVCEGPTYDEDLDSDGDCFIGVPDFAIVRDAFGGPPGPSGIVR